MQILNFKTLNFPPISQFPTKKSQLFSWELIAYSCCLLVFHHYFIMGIYLLRFSNRTHNSIARSTSANGSPEGMTRICVNSIPIKTGKIMMAPRALVFVIMNSVPPTISATAKRGISQIIPIIEVIIFIAFSGRSVGGGK